MERALTIGKLAQAAGVSIETVRYYQRRGLLPEPPKPQGGHRRYNLEQVRQVRFIKRAQTFGFKLDEIGTLLTLDAARSCIETRDLAARKLTQIDRKISEMAGIRSALCTLVRQCKGGGATTDCPIIDVLTRD